MRLKAKKPDYMLALAVFVLCIFGIIMISSASIVISQERFGNNYYYAIHQIYSLIIGLAALVIGYLIDYRTWKKVSTILFLISLLLLIAIFIPGLGQEIGGAHRWISIAGKSFQPSEIVKLSFIIYFASWLESKGHGVRDFNLGFIPFIFLIFVLGFLIMSQPDMGTLSVIALTAVVIFFVAGARYTHLGIATISALIMFVILIKIAPYRMQRFLVFLNPSETLGSAYHINQSLIAIGSGGLWGLGFGQSKQKYLYLPQPHIDSIYAIIAEELGFIRSSIVILAFIFIAFRAYRIIKNAPDIFARYLATGIISWIIIQAFINIAAMLGLVPLTGVPLPFISFGGTSLIVTLFAVGILLNISKFTREEEV